MRDKYLIHTVYNVTRNLTLLNNHANKEDILKHTKIAGSNDGREYTENQIIKCINYLENNRKLIQIRKNQYEVM